LAIRRIFICAENNGKCQNNNKLTFSLSFFLPLVSLNFLLYLIFILLCFLLNLIITIIISLSHTNFINLTIMASSFNIVLEDKEKWYWGFSKSLCLYISLSFVSKKYSQLRISFINLVNQVISNTCSTHPQNNIIKTRSKRTSNLRLACKCKDSSHSYISFMPIHIPLLLLLLLYGVSFVTIDSD
jgi:hypothetical protein